MSAPFQQFPSMDDLCRWFGEHGGRCISKSNRHGKYRVLESPDGRNWLAEAEPDQDECLGPTVIGRLEAGCRLKRRGQSLANQTAGHESFPGHGRGRFTRLIDRVGLADVVSSSELNHMPLQVTGRQTRLPCRIGISAKIRHQPDWQRRRGRQE